MNLRPSSAENGSEVKEEEIKLGGFEWSREKIEEFKDMKVNFSSS